MITSIEKEYLHPQIGFKEIVANALDFGATNIGIDFKVFDHQPIGAIIINDDGRGPIPSDVVHDEAALPTLASFLDVIDLGHSVNLRDDVTKIGGFGLGLKKGLLGIGRNILLATHNEEWVFFLLLSAELNEKLDRDGESMSQIPYLCYNKRTQEWSQSEGCVSYSYGFAAFNEYTAFPDDGGRAELLREALKHLPGIGGGLMILIHNLKPTIDCASVARDIKMAMIECEWDGSLRNYLGLFLNRHKHLGRASHVSRHSLLLHTLPAHRLHPLVSLISDLRCQSSSKGRPSSHTPTVTNCTKSRSALTLPATATSRPKSTLASMA